MTNWGTRPGPGTKKTNNSDHTPTDGRWVGLHHASASESARPGARDYQITAAIAQSARPFSGPRLALNAAIIVAEPLQISTSKQSQTSKESAARSATGGDRELDRSPSRQAPVGVMAPVRYTMSDGTRNGEQHPSRSHEQPKAYPHLRSHPRPRRGGMRRYRSTKTGVGPFASVAMKRTSTSSLDRL